MELMVNIMRRVKTNMSVIVDMIAETVMVMVDEFEASRAEFTFDDTQIMVTNVGTDEKYQKSGYGRILFDALKLVSEQKKMPLVLWSLIGAVSFYEAIGLLHLNDPEVQKRVIFGNVDTADLNKKVNEDDFVFLPQSLNRRKPIIYM